MMMQRFAGWSSEFRSRGPILVPFSGEHFKRPGGDSADQRFEMVQMGFSLRA